MTGVLIKGGSLDRERETCVIWRLRGRWCTRQGEGPGPDPPLEPLEGTSGFCLWHRSLCPNWCWCAMIWGHVHHIQMFVLFAMSRCLKLSRKPSLLRVRPQEPWLTFPKFQERTKFLANISLRTRIKLLATGSFLEVQWLGLCVFTAEGHVLIPD